MALVTNEWNSVTFFPFSDPSWTPFPAGGVPAEVGDAVVGSSDLLIFVLDASDPVQFTYLGAGSQVISLPAAVFDADNPETTNVQVIDSSGETWYSMRRTSDGAWLCYPNQSGIIFEVDDPTALSAFLAP